MSDISFNDKNVARSVAERSFAYGTLSVCIEYPDDDLLDAINSGSLLQGIEAIYADGISADDYAGLNRQTTAGELQTDYMSMFEVSNPQGAICSLFAGDYYSNRMQVMEEHVRFYNFFELHMPDKIEELPDHLSAQLEFLHFLTSQEALALQGGSSPDSFRKAQRDFITRHPLRWIDQLEGRVVEVAKTDFFPHLIKLIKNVLSLELARVTRTLDSNSIPAVDMG